MEDNGAGPAMLQRTRERDMDTTRFDRITAELSQNTSRRGVLRFMGAAALATGGLASLVGFEADARRKKRKSKGRGNGKHRSQSANPDAGSGNNPPTSGGGNGSGQTMCYRPGTACSSHDQCCYSTTNSMCAVSSYASNSDKTCCGGQGAVCGPRNDDGDYLAPHCCAGYECAYDANGGHGTCLLLVEL